MPQALRDGLAFLLPWEFSPLAFVLCVGGVVAYAVGLSRMAPEERPSRWRSAACLIGFGLVWFVTQTRFDYYAQHMFFLHRVAHLVLHHLGAFLIALSNPVAVLARGLPRALTGRVLAPLWRRPAMQLAVRLVQNVWVAPVIFVGLIYFWLTPAIHFVAMLSPDVYWVMNWSMFLDGLLFWALVLDPRGPPTAWAGFGARIWMLILAMPPQIVLGAYISLSGVELFDVYGLCGRAWDMSAATDQTIGGLVTWIPAAMMHVVGALIVISRWMHADRGRPAPRAPLLVPGAGD
ncbi:MAG TPA: cytochrome c oxidase assembly protein [Usitatibacter sp.]|nr:cytochrome c oxidase assembly protein [Usitatibacter sp.]